MGVGAAKTLTGIFAGGCEEGSPWQKQGRGPKLRQLFGAYRHVDLWDAYRRFKQICSDGNGHITFQEAKQVVPVAEFSLLFVWDIFSQQNELLDARTLLAAVGVFSSAKLVEKAHFLLSLFDASGCGRCTGAEIAQICHAVCGVLARCTGSVVKAKELTAQLQQELPALLPEFREAAERDGSQVAFQNERLVGRTELDRLVPSIEAEYEALPVAGPPPDKADSPPPRHLRNPGVPGSYGAYPQVAERGLLRDSSSGLLAVGGGPSAVRALAGQATLASQHAAVPLKSERSGAVGKQGASPTTSMAPARLVGNSKQLLHDQGSQTSPAFMLEALRRTLALEKERLARAEAAEADARAALLEREAALTEIRACREAVITQALEGVETRPEAIDLVTGASHNIPSPDLFNVCKLLR